MEYLVNDWIGGTHLIALIIALITGSLVLILKKGTEIHRKIGYGYVTSTVVTI